MGLGCVMDMGCCHHCSSHAGPRPAETRVRIWLRDSPLGVWTVAVNGEKLCGVQGRCRVECGCASGPLEIPSLRLDKGSAAMTTPKPQINDKGQSEEGTAHATLQPTPLPW